jgi:phosphoribosylanthranilate isomerase
MTKVKICGLKRKEDIEYVNQYQPEYIGFVFAESKRKVTDALAKELKSELDQEIKAVGVFVNEPIEHIVSLCKQNIIDVIQLHGDEDAVYIRDLQVMIPNRIIKAVRVQTKEQINEAQSLPVDVLLFDTYHKNQYGGSGMAFNWEMIPKIEKPYFLAGGLNIDNVSQAIDACHPYCVDISSGVETNGMKDEKKIKDIIQLIRNL